MADRVECGLFSPADVAVIPPGLTPAETAACLRREDDRITRKIRQRSIGPWRPGRGEALAAALCLLKETVITRILDTLDWDSRRIAVIGLGGLGRREVAPGSDLDILILHAPGAAVEEFVRGFLYILWDSGYEVTASTRTAADCLSHAASDATFLTALLQTRLLAGAVDLFARLRRRFARRIKRWGQPLIDEWLKEERDAANARPPLYLRQPHLKKKPGGLRAVQTLEWCAAILAGHTDPARVRSILSSGESRRLAVARDYLLFLRIRLHFLQNTREDVLVLDSQQSLAADMRLRGGGIEAVRSLMRFYYKEAHVVHQLLYRCLENAWRSRRPLRRGCWARAGAPPFHIARGVLYVASRLPPSARSAWLVLERLSREPLLFSDSVVGYLERCMAFFNPWEVKAFISHRLPVLLSAPYSAQSLWALHFSGLLFRLVPELLPVRRLYMYNPVHLWPVDVHTIAAVAALESVCAGVLPGPLPEYMSLLTETAVLYRDKSWVLKLAMLLHDAGKGFPGDHAKNGVEVAARFLPAAGVPPQYRAAVQFLIEHHLLLATAVRRRDTTDPRLLDDLAVVFFLSPYPEEYLDLLFLFTFADAWATNPRNLTGYFALTFTRVYQRVRELVVSHPRDREGAAGGHRDFPPELSEDHGFSAFCKEVGERYLERHENETVVRDYRLFSSLAPGKFHLELSVSPEVARVTVFAWDRPGLFALLAGVLARNGAAIVRADIHTRRGRALDEFAVTHIFESASESLSETDDGRRWSAVLLRDLYTYQHDIDRLSADLAGLRRTTRVLGARFSYPARVAVVERRPDGALIEVSGHDRPALLFDLAWAMARAGVNINRAFIDTTGWLAHDVFDVQYTGAAATGVAALLRLLQQVLEIPVSS